MSKASARHSVPTGQPPVPALALFPPSTVLIRRNPAPFVLVSLLPGLLWLLVNYSAWDTSGRLVYPTLGLFGVGIIGLYSLLVLATAPLLQLRSLDGAIPAFPEVLRQSFHYYWRMLGLVVAIGFLVFFGFILFIVPGIIAIKRYALAPYALIEQDGTIRQALRRSAELSRGHTWDILSVLLVEVLFSLLDLVPVIGQLLGSILDFLYSPAPAIRYRELTLIETAGSLPKRATGKK